MPKISIIVPIYNIEKYIAECIDSILAQTFTDWELILVNDGSTDNSGKICDEYAQKDSRIKVIHKDNEGVTATRDRGVKEAQGEFLFFIDGDDYITENALELFINKQQENDADLVRGNFVLCNENGDIIPSKIKNFDFDNKYDWLRCVINEGGYICNSLVKKGIFIQAYTIPQEMTIYEDLLISFNLFSYINKVKKLESQTYIYVQYQHSASHSYKSEKNIYKTYNSVIILTKEISKIRDKYLTNLKKHNIKNLIDLLIAKKIFDVLCCYDILLKKHKKQVLKLYIKYFALNYNVQKSIITDSWKCFLYNWFSLIKIIF